MNEHQGTNLLVALARAAGRLATFCDRQEHSETADRAAIREVGATLRETALAYAADRGLDPFELYVARLAHSERGHVLATSAMTDGAHEARSASTWRQLQLAQA